jgi:2-polyprenyl-3-methyl-5-hydroxy-6-metoxy-1,4-benzoquinol methylase
MMLAARAIAEERMDDPALDPAIYAQVLTDLARVNTVTMARRPTLSFLHRALARSKQRQFRLLDVGFGDGDMLRAIARWAKAKGFAAELVGIDLNPRSAAIAAKATTADLDIAYRTGDYNELADDPWTFIVSSLVAHHMTHAQLVAFIGFMERHASSGWLINDLHRHGFAWTGYPLLTRLMGWHEIVRHDGQLSIARSYRPHEWPPILAEAGAETVRVYRAFPFRLCVERIQS